jgi:hypothetical protein
MLRFVAVEPSEPYHLQRGSFSYFFIAARKLYAATGKDSVTLEMRSDWATRLRKVELTRERLQRVAERARGGISWSSAELIM